jgi:hypothetical protein
MNLILKTYNFLEEKGISALLSLFFVTEAFSKYHLNIQGSRLIYPKAVKTIVMILIIISLLKNKKTIIQLIAIALGFVIGQLCLNPNFDQLIINSFIKYCFLIALLAYVKYNITSTKQIESLFNAFEILIVFNSLLIFIGFIFKIPVLETYNGHRFGYNGLLISSATSTYVYFTALVYLFFKYQKKLITNIKPIIVLLSSVLVGTKALMMALILCIILYVLVFTSNKKKLISTILIIIIGLGSSYYIFFEWGAFDVIIKEKGLLSSILSFRNDIVVNETLPFISNDWSIINYFFGGINDITSRPEMGLLDMLYFFGFAGTITYLWSFTNYFFDFKLNKINLFFVVVLFTIVFLSGNFFLNASVPIYLIILVKSFKTQITKG